MDHQGSRRSDHSLDHHAPAGGGHERYLRAPTPGKSTLASRVYRSAAGPSATRPDQGAAAALDRAARGTGHAIPDGLRASLEQALGTRLDHVRLHDDGASAEAARSIRASAYAIGNDIFFAGGSYAPDDVAGQRLIAHEVAHTVQTGGGPAPARPGELEISQPGDDHEVEADRFADDFVAGRAAAPVPAARGGGLSRSVIHRSPEEGRKPAAPEKTEKEKERARIKKALEDVRGHAMFALVPAVRELEPAAARTDEAMARAVGGPRLVLAMRAAHHRGGWLDFVNAQQQTLAGIPGDQISDIMGELGAPASAAYFSEDRFGGLFDGMVDPAAGTLTLYWRVKVVSGGGRFGASAPGTPAAAAETTAALAAFKKGLPGAIEKVWKATLRPKSRIGSLTTLRCAVKVTVVESGEHRVIHLQPHFPGARARMPTKKADGPGTFHDQCNHESPEEEQMTTDRGLVKVQQNVSAHEFGHALGRGHPLCDTKDDRCYGLAADEKGSIMGHGNQLKATSARHNDFKPFQDIAQEWGKTFVYPGALAPHNRWLPQ